MYRIDSIIEDMVNIDDFASQFVSKSSKYLISVFCPVLKKLAGEEIICDHTV